MEYEEIAWRLYTDLRTKVTTTNIDTDLLEEPGMPKRPRREKVSSMSVAVEVDAGRLWERIQAARQARHMSQNELARLAEMTVQNLQKIEQGYTKTIPYETLDAICRALGVPIKKMMRKPEEKPEEDNSEEGDIAA